MTLTEKKIDELVAEAYRRGHAAGMKQKAEEISNSIEELFKTKHWVR